MAKIFDKLFNTKAKSAQKPADVAQFRPVAKPKYSFVEQYTIVDPKEVLNGGYSLWALCERVPVICEESETTPLGFKRCIELPTNIVMGFLSELEQKPAEQIADPKMRTLSIVHLSKDHRIVIGPNFESPKNPIFWPVSATANKKEWILHVTPEKNRAIVDALKIHTR